MDRDLLSDMCADRPDLVRQGDRVAPSDDVTLDLLLRAEHGGTVPLSKVVALTLGARFVTVETAESTWTLGYGSVAGLRTTKKGESRARRTGFSA